MSSLNKSLVLTGEIKFEQIMSSPDGKPCTRGINSLP